jgi:hypothetical protein
MDVGFKKLAVALAFASFAMGSVSAQMSSPPVTPDPMTSPPTSSEHATPTKPMKMTSAEKAKMKSCMKMSQDMMMADSECVRLKAIHDNIPNGKM